jgi:hypothetical protein
MYKSSAPTPDDVRALVEPSDYMREEVADAYMLGALLGVTACAVGMIGMALYDVYQMKKKNEKK